MRKNSSLVASVALLFVLATALGYVAYRRYSKARGTGLALVPRESLAVVGIDFARLRGYAPARRMRAHFLTRPSVAEHYRSIVATCGFDPFDRLETALFAWDHDAAFGSSNSPLAVVNWRGRAGDAIRCLGAIIRTQDTHSQLTPVASVDGRPVFAVAQTGQGPYAQARIAPFENRIVVGSSAELSQEFPVLDGKRPGADRNDSLRTGVSSLGGGLLMFFAADMQALSQFMPRDLNQFSLASLTSDRSPDAPNGTSNLLGLAIGLEQMRGEGLRLVGLGTYRTLSDSQMGATMATQALTSSRGPLMSELLGLESDYMRRMAEAQSNDASLGARIPDVQQAFQVVNGLLNRVRIQATGTVLRVELEVPTQDVATLETGARAMSAVDASVSRARPSNEGIVPPPPSIATPGYRF